MNTLIVVKVAHSFLKDSNIAPALVPEENKQPKETSRHFWAWIENKLKKLGMDWHRVRVYQEGLPLARPGLISEVIDKSAEKSHNYGLIKKLAGYGASIEGTENPALLLEEYELFKDSDAGKDKTKSEFEKTKSDFVEKRDIFIAKRIAETLKPNETGILFIGPYHHVCFKLPKNISSRIL